MTKFKDLPKEIPIFPLSNFIIFPETTVPLNIFEPRYIQMIDDAMKSVGLSDIKANINHSLRNVLRDADGNLVFGIRQRKEGDQDVREFGWQGSGIVVETSPDAGVQAMYSNAANEIFLGMDRLDTSKPIDQQINEALELLSHEQVHAMRTMNLFTDKEWQTLSKAAANRKSKTESDKTFLEIAEREYAGEPDEVIIEEAVAELVRVSRKDPAVVTGKPKSLIKKIYNFFADLIGFRDSTGFESFQDLITDIETGVVGARERGGRIPVEARRRAEEVAEQTRTPDFIDPELDLDDPNSEVEIISSLNDRMSRRSPTKAKTPKKTVKAYKLFRIEDNDKSNLFPLFVDADTPVETGVWVKAKAGEINKETGKVKSKLGDLAYRPGWHSGDTPSAKHIGGISDNRYKGKKPDYRKANQVWAEVEVPADFDWQSVANSRASIVKSGPRKGLLNVKQAHITDQVPEEGHYRYKTNPNMKGNWIISGSMKVNKLLTPAQYKKILEKARELDLPTLPEVIDQKGLSFDQLRATAKEELREYYPKKFKELTASARNISGALEDRYARRRSSTPVESAVDLAKTKYADYNSAVEEEFFGKFWPQMMAEIKGTVTVDKVRTAAKRAVQDINEFVSRNPKYKDYYDSDQAAVLESLSAEFDNITSDDLLFYQLANGLSSPATSLPANVGDALNFLALYKQDGNLDAIQMGLSAKNNPVIKKAPFKVSGTTGSGKARSMKVIDRLIKENNNSPTPVADAVDYLQEGVSAKELQAFNKQMGYKSAVPNMKAIRSLVKQATGQDEKIPRMFIFGKKVGAYTLNLTGETTYTTIDVWESRFIRSYFDGLFAKNFGLPVTVDEDMLFQDFSKEFKKEYEKFTDSSVDASALQAMRWFYIINAAKESGYRGASTNETISELTEKYIQKRRSGEGRDNRGRKSDAKIAQEIQQETTLLPERYSRSTNIIDYIKENPDGFTVDPVTLETPSGVAVAPVKALEVKFAPEDVTEDLIDQTVDNYKLLADELDRDVYIGGWFNNDDGLFYLDASITTESKEEALYIADAGKQEAVFDLNTFEETRTDEGIRYLKETVAYDSQAADAARRDKEKLDRLFANAGDRDQAEEVRQRADGTTVGGDPSIPVSYTHLTLPTKA